MEAWSGIYQARKFGSKCLQLGSEPGSFYYKEFYSHPEFDVSQSEDCLYLNIWVPDHAENEQCPVALWIHGGAFSNGTGSELPFVGTEFVKRKVILVTINYRLGVFGFLCHPLITELNSAEEGCANYGLWDQVMALNWVYENIGAFGGNSKKITLFGQSAGAMSLQQLAETSAINNHCSGMILQSGGGYGSDFNRAPYLDDAYKVGENLMEKMGIPKNLWKESEAGKQQTYHQLYEISAEELQKYAGKMIAESLKTWSPLPFVPVIDKDLLKEDVDEMIEAKKFQKIPYILGANSQDMAASDKLDKTPDDDMMHRANVDFAKIANTCDDASAYVYYFKRQLPGDDAGAFHSAELWYIFGCFEYCWRPMTGADRALSDEMIDCWTNFMYTGNPGKDWKPCTKEESFVKIFDVVSHSQN